MQMCSSQTDGTARSYWTLGKTAVRKLMSHDSDGLTVWVAKDYDYKTNNDVLKMCKLAATTPTYRYH